MGEARAEISFCILLFIPANIVVPCQHYVRAEKLGGGREGGREGISKQRTDILTEEGNNTLTKLGRLWQDGPSASSMTPL